MKKVIIRLTTILGVMAVVLFISIFIWANWTPLSVGEKVDPVNFVTYDATPLHSDHKASLVSSALKQMEGVGGCNNVPAIKGIIVIYKPLEIEESEIISNVREQFGVNLQRLKVADTGKRCPMTGSLTFFTKVRRALNIRG